MLPGAVNGQPWRHPSGFPELREIIAAKTKEALLEARMEDC
jgi:hypothetical protein